MTFDELLNSYETKYIRGHFGQALRGGLGLRNSQPATQNANFDCCIRVLQKNNF